MSSSTALKYSILKAESTVNNLDEIDLFAELEKEEIESQPQASPGNDNTEGANQGITALNPLGSIAQISGKRSRLTYIDAYTLSKLPLPPIKYIIDNLISVGLHVLAGSPKVGKSWLMLWIGLMVSSGQSIWGNKTAPGSVLYLALEDNKNRLQTRMNLVLNGQVAPSNLYYATEAMSTSDGLLKALEEWVLDQKAVNQNPQLIIIDTFQKIRGHTSSDNAYANDYRDAGELKKFADKHEIAVIIVHHTRKQGDQDVFNTISGSTGLTGATDTMIVVKKQGRGSDEAIFYATGRDIEEMELAIKFNSTTCKWDLVSSNASQYLQQKKLVSNPVAAIISQFLNNNGGKWSGKASDLYNLLFDGISDIEKEQKGLPKASNTMTRFFNNNISVFEANNIKYVWDTSKNNASYVHLEQIPPISPEPPQIEEYQYFEDELE